MNEHDKAYDEAVEVWRDATRKVLSVGSDDPELTASDLRDMFEDLIAEAAE